MKLELESLTERIVPSATNLAPLTVLANPTSATVASANHSNAQTSQNSGTILSSMHGASSDRGSAVPAPSEANIASNVSGAQYKRVGIPNKQISPLTGSYSETWVAPGENGDYNWSDPLNWSMDETPIDGMTVVFDGSVDNAECLVNIPTASVNIVLQNGYTSTIETVGNNQGSLNIAGFQDNTPATDVFNVAFLGGADTVNFTGGGTQTIDDSINWGTGGKTNVLNGTVVNFGIGSNLTQSTGSPINVTNGQINFGDDQNNGNYCTLNLTSSSADINIGPNGTMGLNQTGVALIDNSRGPGAVINNNGTVNLVGVTGGKATNINVPLQNHATLNVTDGGIWWFNDKDASGNDLSMDAGTIIMEFGASKIYCLHQYTQKGGTFNVQYSQATLWAGNAAYFSGGTLEFTYLSQSVLNSGNIEFNGAALDMRIWADSSNSDLINCTTAANCTITSSSTINVTLEGTQEGYSTWTLIQMASGTLTGDFQQPPNLPGGFSENYSSSAWGCQSTD